jgi:hypothetical protein
LPLLGCQNRVEVYPPFLIVIDAFLFLLKVSEKIGSS